jgi:hypothetical protein
LEDLKKPPYPVALQEEDFQLVCKKLSFTNDEMKDYLKRSPKKHSFYPTNDHMVEFFKKWLKKFNLY